MVFPSQEGRTLIKRLPLVQGPFEGSDIAWPTLGARIHAVRVEETRGEWVQRYRDSGPRATFLVNMVVTASAHAMVEVHRGACSVRSDQVDV